MKRVQLIISFLLLFSAAMSQEKPSTDSLINLALEVFQVDIDSTLRIADLMIERGKEENHTFGIVRGHYYKAFIYKVYKGNSQKALINNLEAVRQYELNPDSAATKDAAAIYENLGRDLTDFEQYETALYFFAKSINRYKRLNDTETIAEVIVSQSELFRMKGDTAMALAIIDSAIAMVPQLSPTVASTVYNRIGITYQSLGMYKDAINSYKETSNQAKGDSSGLRMYIAGIHNVGNAQTFDGQTDSAALSFKNSYKLYYENSDLFQPYSFFYVNLDVGEYHFKIGSYDSALFYFDRALSYTESFNISASKEDFRIYKLISESYFKVDEEKLGMMALSKYQEHLESFLEERENTQSETEKLNMELILTKYFESVDRNASADDSLFWISIVSSALTLSLIGYFITYRRREKLLRASLESELRNIMRS